MLDPTPVCSRGTLLVSVRWRSSSWMDLARIRHGACGNPLPVRYAGDVSTRELRQGLPASIYIDSSCEMIPSSASGHIPERGRHGVIGERTPPGQQVASAIPAPEGSVQCRAIIPGVVTATPFRAVCGSDSAPDRTRRIDRSTTWGPAAGLEAQPSRTCVRPRDTGDDKGRRCCHALRNQGGRSSPRRLGSGEGGKGMPSSKMV